MQRTRNILFNSCFAFNALLVFMLVFEQKLSIPAWLQVAGRAHPLILHFPITILILYIGWTLFFEKKQVNEQLYHLEMSFYYLQLLQHRLLR